MGLAAVDLDVLIPLIVVVGAVMNIALIVFVLVLWRKLEFVLHELAGVAHRADKSGSRLVPGSAAFHREAHGEPGMPRVEDSSTRSELAIHTGTAVDALTTSDTADLASPHVPIPPSRGGGPLGWQEGASMGPKLEAWINEVIQ